MALESDALDETTTESRARSRTSARQSISDTVQVTDWERDIPGSFSEDRRTWLFPIVRGMSRNGKVTKWLISVRIYRNIDCAEKDLRVQSESREHESCGPLVVTPDIARNVDQSSNYIARLLIHYQMGTGVVQVRTPTYVTQGKKTSTVARTNIYCQALRDALSLYNKQLRRVSAPNIDRDDLNQDRDDRAMSRESFIPRPMLAQVYKDVYPADDIAGPIYVQRKYNGVRAIATNTADGKDGIIYSRTGLQYSGFQELRKCVARLCYQYAQNPAHNCAQLYLDGELYKHGARLQELSGIVRRIQSSTRDITAQNELTYVIYDLFIRPSSAGAAQGSAAQISRAPFSERLRILREFIAPHVDRTCAVAETYLCDAQVAQSSIEVQPKVARALREVQPKVANAEHLIQPQVVQHVKHAQSETRPSSVALCAREYYSTFLREGYEGAIIRLDREYEQSFNARHSRFLLKMKPTYDAEFPIIGWTVGNKGRARGALMFICAATDADGSRHEFNVTPTGTIDSRVTMARDFARIEDNGHTVFENKWQGRPLIVKYDELSANGVPQRARTDGEIRELP